MPGRQKKKRRNDEGKKMRKEKKPKLQIPNHKGGGAPGLVFLCDFDCIVNAFVAKKN
jgi:hypothetical protein